MTTTRKELLTALATLLGARSFNGCLDARMHASLTAITVNHTPAGNRHRIVQKRRY